MEKHFLLTMVLLVAVFNSEAQNLVPNGDFEQYTSCPNNLDELYKAAPWMNPSTASPDYKNQCSGNSTTSVPDNTHGYQVAHSGGGYAGMCLMTQPPFAPEYRENIEAPLLSPLVANSCYHFEMYVSFGNVCQLAVEDIGVYFSTSIISGVGNYNPLPYTPQITNTTGYLSDTLNWMLVSGNYTAAGGESYLTIGNFNDDANTNFIITNPGAQYQFSYYFIDDVSLTLTPCTGINEENSNSEIKIYPNPVKDELSVNCHSFGKKEIVITDILGKEIFRDEFRSSNFKLQTLNYKQGIYFLEINDGKNTFRKKFLKAD
jgi:hypothetical protein